MSDISLSKAVRSNLLSLQGTATMMSKTQDRLATGNKVNSALDNPSNFFTASALNSRAGDMNGLMDSMANGIQTLEAADNGLTSITKTLESMQSTLRQARQDKSFQTASYTLDPARTGSISLSGGAIGDTAVDIKLTQATPESVTAGVEYKSVQSKGLTGSAAATAATAFGTAGVLDLTGGHTITFQGNKDAAAVSITLDEDSTGFADVTKATLAEVNTAINQKLSDHGSSLRVRDKAGSMELYDTDASNVGTGATATVLGAEAGSGYGFTGLTLGAAGAGTADAPQAITINSVAISLDGDTHNTAEKAAAFINVKLKEAGTVAAEGVTASVKDGKLVLSGPADGSAKAITIGGAAGDLAVFGPVASRSTTTASPDSGPAKSVDALISEINNNNDLKGKIRASNDNGKLRIENMSTTALKVDGVSTGGAVDGISTGASEILGNSVRSGLADQFNELRDQLDKLADDASFNGINLLRGDKLTITFNETGTSSIDIATKGEKSVNSTNLGVATTLNAADLDSDANIDKELAKLKSALNDVRSQSSAFGSNLSIVQNRQDFTKSMINTLQTGAANLTLADMNEEAANLLALQTRQSLSSSSLSLASQADQSVLQLIR
ncbi:MAG: flagellin [Devosia sp.]